MEAEMFLRNNAMAQLIKNKLQRWTRGVLEPGFL